MIAGRRMQMCTGNDARPFLQAQNHQRRTKSTVRRASAAENAPTAAQAAHLDADAVILDSEDEAARPRSAGTKRPAKGFVEALQQTGKSIGLGFMAALSPTKSSHKSSKDSALHGEAETSISLRYTSCLAVGVGTEHQEDLSIKIGTIVMPCCLSCPTQTHPRMDGVGLEQGPVLSARR